jgi:hypothetical protein
MYRCDSNRGATGTKEKIPLLDATVTQLIECSIALAQD